MGMTDKFFNYIGNRINEEKDIVNYEPLIIDNITTFGGGIDRREKNPILENIYETIANDISLGRFRHVVKDDNSFKLKEYSDIQLVLDRRPNSLQSPSEFMNAFTYQLIKYGNAIAIPYYSREVERKFIEIDGIDYDYIETKNGYTLESIELVDVSNMTFGFGYDDDGEKYLIYKSCITEDTQIIRYSNIIHIRHQPKNIFYGDKMYNYNFNMIPDLLDRNISSMLTMLGQGGSINGILQIKNGMNSQKGASRSQRVSDFMNSVNKGVVLADANEEFKQLTKSFDVVSSESLDSALKYLYSMYGINENIITGNYTAQEFSAYYNHTIEPILNKIEQEFSYKLIGISKFKRGHRLMFRKKLIAGATLKDITSFVDKGMYQGWLNGNIVADLLGLDHYEDGDIRYTNLNAVQIGDEPNVLRGGDDDDTETNNGATEEEQ